MHDDELRALFACAQPSIPAASQVVFALRTLSGFSTREIAARLVTSEENVQKRWERARDQLRRVNLERATDAAEWPDRAAAVLRMIYVLFTEGYLAPSRSPHPSSAACSRAAARRSGRERSRAPKDVRGRATREGSAPSIRARPVRREEETAHEPRPTGGERP